jgi:hypothetical protein
LVAEPAGSERRTPRHHDEKAKKMRKTMLWAASAALILASLAVAVPAGAAGEHPGCKGVDQASTKASAKGKEALAVVSLKFGCGSVIPDTTDPVACPAESVSLGRSTYLGGPTTDKDEYGYAIWEGAWTNSAETNSAGVVYNASADGRGFYFFESATSPVTSIVAKSIGGTIVTITDVPPAGDPEWILDPSKAVSHNWFSTVTGAQNEPSGFNLVNFCGAAA